VQRFACLLTTGAMKNAPTIALEAILYLPPLPAMVIKEAAQSVFIILDSFKQNTGDMQGHLKIYEDFQGVMDQHALSDKMSIRLVRFEKGFISPSTVKSLKPKSILGFLKAVGLFSRKILLGLGQTDRPTLKKVDLVWWLVTFLSFIQRLFKMFLPPRQHLVSWWYIVARFPSFKRSTAKRLRLACANKVS
jgi:hypothetical protein